MRAIWKGHISFSLVVIPVRIYSAVEPSESISFNQLHKEDLGRIGYDKKCKKCQQKVSTTDIVKGYEYTKDKYVIIDPEDFDKIKLSSTKVIQIEGFLDSSDVQPVLYDTPYFIGPDGEIAAKAYNLLMQTMRETGKVGVGRVVIRDREDVVLISPLEKGLVLYKIRYPNEVRNIEEVPQLKEIKIDKNEMNLAKSLVETMSVKLGDLEVKDRYKEALKELIESKLEGREIADAGEVKVAPVIDLMAALKESLNKSKDVKKLPMQKAKGKSKKGTAAPKRKQA